MKLICEFCKAVDGDDPDDNGTIGVDAYLVGGKIRFACGACTQKELPFNERQPLNLPEGWEIVPSDALKTIKDSHEQFMKLSKAIRMDGRDINIMRHDISWLYSDLIENHKNRREGEKTFRQSLGIVGFEMDVISRAHCPNCAGPMIRLVTIDQDDAIKYADYNQDVISKAMDAPSTLACLNCAAAYVD